MGLLSQIQTGKTRMPPRIMVYGIEGIGKAQPLDARVLTPRGFVAMREVKVDDRVIGSDGKAHRVLGVYPRGKKDVYRVTFRDGSATECCDDHLWFTQTRGERDRGLTGAVRSLRDIRKTLRYGTHFNHGVPRVRPVEFEVMGDRLPVDPWLLGMYLGDGYSSGNVVITNPEPDIQERIAASLEDGDTCVRDGTMVIRVKAQRKTNRPAIMRAALQELCLDHLKAQEKYIPAVYLHATVQQRLDLLRGLLDSDGFVTNPGSIEFSTTSPRLAEGVCFLIRSLGGSAKQTTKRPTYTHRGEKREGMLAYRVFASFPADVVPVSSKKHVAKWAAPQWALRHTIRSVEYVGKKSCQCIRIEAPDSLYVTDDFILTHNSLLASKTPKPVFVQTEDGLGEIDCHKFPLARSLEDAENALTALHTEEHPYRTVVVDSLDWLERMIWDRLCKAYGVASIEKVDGGYGKGYVHALSLWRKVVDQLVALRDDRGMMVVLLAHAKVEKFEDPEAPTYDRYSPRLNKHASALVSEWCDAVLFATRRIITRTEDGTFNRSRTIAAGQGKDGGERILRCVGGPSCIAKNRYDLPAELPLDWAPLMAAISGTMNTTNQPSTQGEKHNG